MRNLLFALLLILLSLLPFRVAAQDSTHNAKAKYDTSTVIQPVSFEESAIEEYRQKKDFNYLQEQANDSWWSRFKRWLNRKLEDIFHWLFGDYEASSFLTFIFEVLPYLLLAILIGFILWLFIMMDPGRSLTRKKEAPEVFLNEEEELIQSRDLPTLIQEAVQKGQYRLAIRYYYLQVLKFLDEDEYIEYRYQKTNADYSSEIQEEEIREQFQSLTRIYDFIWYGDFRPSKEEFNMAEKGFFRMNTLMNRNAE